MKLPAKLMPLYSTLMDIIHEHPHRIWDRDAIRLELMRLHQRSRLSLRVVDRLTRKASEDRRVLIVWHHLRPHYRAL